MKKRTYKTVSEIRDGKPVIKKVQGLPVKIKSLPGRKLFAYYADRWLSPGLLWYIASCDCGFYFCESTTLAGARRNAEIIGAKALKKFDSKIAETMQKYGMKKPLNR